MMSSGFKKTAAAIAMSAMVIAPIATAGLVLTTEAAFAKSAKGESKSAGKSDRGKNASALKNMNAVNSWKNGQGKDNAAETSNVGLIATYLDLAFLDITDLQTAAEVDLAAFLLSHELDPTAAALNYDAACAGLSDDSDVSDCIAAESAYDVLAAAVALTYDGGDLAFDNVAPAGLAPDGDAMDYFFNNVALSF